MVALTGKHDSITELNVRDNFICDLGALELSKALRSNTSLRTLHLNGTNIQVGDY
jgi:hypothetical protein